MSDIAPSSAWIDNMQQIFDAMPQPCLVLLPDAPAYTIMAVNNAFLQITFTARQDVIDRPLFDVFPPGAAGDNAELSESLQHVLEHKQPHRLDMKRYDIPAKKTEERIHRYWSRVNTPVVENGAVKYIVHTITDVTERVVDNLRRKANDDRFRNMIEQAPVALGVLRGESMVIETANSSMLELWGKTEKILGKPLIEALPEIIDQPFPQLLQHVYKTGEAHYGYETEAWLMRCGVLEPCYFNFVYAPYREADGIITGITVVATDVTPLVKAKQDLEKSEKRFRDLVDQTAVATAVYVGTDLHVELANDAMIKLWGKDPSVVGKRLAEALPELEGQPFLHLLADVYTTGVTYQATEDAATLMINGKLQTNYFNFFYKALHNADGSIYGILNMAIDVTEQVLARHKIQESEDRYRKLSAELEERVQTRTADLEAVNESLGRSNKELEQFAYVASHDLQEPLRKIQAFGDILKNRFRQNIGPEGADIIDRMQSASGRMKVLIEDLLSFSRVSSDKSLSEEVDLNRILQDVQSDLYASIKEKQATITKDLLLPVKGSAMQFRQMFQNLLSNSLKFTRDGVSPVISITSSIIKGKDSGLPVINGDHDTMFQLIEIKDNGIGFEQQYAEKIFQIFQRLHGRHEHPGSGIGLSIVKKVVENHNGYIDVSSEPDKGATFRILLPEM